ncbi:mucin-3A-like isoform X2 [Mercenaria mercenaria]|uniref:mucin-3A-like isoform X2 n=1 Tax=Mercenaria mercenaria TaxID=6596 RepID=UPI00234E59AE|nr:mucin-3A-like isoform X2 [Mercenaria mercenaria]
MKNRKVLPWILIMILKSCMSSTTVSSDFTILPSPDFSSNLGADTTKHVDYSSSSSFTIETTQTLISPPVRTMQPITASSTDLPSMPGSKLTSDQTIGESSKYSNLGTDSLIQVTSIHDIAKSLSTTYVDSTNQLHSSFTDILTATDSLLNSLIISASPSSSLEIVSYSSKMENIGPSSTTYYGNSQKGSKINVESSDSSLHELSANITATQVFTTTQNNFRNSKTTEMISATVIQSAIGSDSLTDIFTSSSTSKMQALQSSSSRQNSNIFLESSVKSYVINSSMLSSVIHTESLASSETLSMLITSVISATLSAGDDSIVSELLDNSGSSSILSSSPALSSVQKTMDVASKSVLSSSETNEKLVSMSKFSQPVTTGSSYSESLSIVKSSMLLSESLKHITPSPDSKSLSMLESVMPMSSFTSSGQIDTDFDSVQRSSSMSASDSSTNPRIFSSTDLSASILSGKSSDGFSTGNSMLSKDTSLSYYFNTLDETSLVTSGFGMSDTTNIITILSTPTMSSEANTINSASRISSVRHTAFLHTSVDLSLDNTQEYETVSSMRSDNKLTSKLFSNYLHYSKTLSSVTQSSETFITLSNSNDLVGTTNFLNYSLYYTGTRTLTYITGINSVNNFSTVLPSESVYLSSDFITLSGDTTDLLIQGSSSILPSLSTAHDFTSQYIPETIRSTSRVISSRLLDTETFTSSFLSSYAGNSMSLFSPTEVSITPHLSSLPSEMYSSETENMKTSVILRNTDYSGTFQLTVSNSTITLPTTETSSFSRYDATNRSLDSRITSVRSASWSVSDMSFSSTFNQTVTSIISSQIGKTLSYSDKHSSLESKQSDSTSTPLMSAIITKYSAQTNSFPSQSRTVSWTAAELVSDTSFWYSPQSSFLTITPTTTSTTSNTAVLPTETRLESMQTVSTTSELSYQTSELLSSIIPETSSAYLVSDLPNTKSLLSSDQYRTVLNITTSTATSVFDKITSLSSPGQTTVTQLNISSSFTSMPSVFSSEQMTMSTEVQENTATLSFSSSDASQATTLGMTDTVASLRTLQTEVPTSALPINSSSTAVLFTSFTPDTLATYTSINSHSSIRTGLSINGFSTTDTSVISHLSFSSLKSPTIYIEQSSSLLTNSNSVTFLTEASLQTHTTVATADLSNTLTVSSSLVITPSKASTSISHEVSSSQNENSTTVLTTTGNKSAYVDTFSSSSMVPITSYSILQSFESGSISFSYVTEALTSVELISTSYGIVTEPLSFTANTSFSQNALVTSVYKTFDIYSNSSIFSVSSHSINSPLLTTLFVSNTSSTFSSVVELSMSSPDFTDISTLAVVTDSKSTTEFFLSISSETLVTLVGSTIVSTVTDITKSLISPSNVFNFTPTPAENGSQIIMTSRSSFSSIEIISSVLVSSLDSNLPGISTTDSYLTTHGSFISAIPTISTVRIDSSLLTSVTHLSLNTNSVEFSTKKDTSINVAQPTSTVRLDSSLVSLSSHSSSLYTHLASSSTMEESITIFIPLTVRTESSTVSSTTHASFNTDLSITFKLPESPTTLSLLSTEHFSSASQSYLTVSGVSALSSPTSEMVTDVTYSTSYSTATVTESVSLVPFSSIILNNTSIPTSLTTLLRSSTSRSITELLPASVVSITGTVVRTSLQTTPAFSNVETSAVTPHSLHSSKSLSDTTVILVTRTASLFSTSQSSTKVLESSFSLSPLVSKTIMSSRTYNSRFTSLMSKTSDSKLTLFSTSVVQSPLSLTVKPSPQFSASSNEKISEATQSVAQTFSSLSTATITMPGSAVTQNFTSAITSTSILESSLLLESTSELALTATLPSALPSTVPLTSPLTLKQTSSQKLTSSLQATLTVDSSTLRLTPTLLSTPFLQSTPILSSKPTLQSTPVLSSTPTLPLTETLSSTPTLKLTTTLLSKPTRPSTPALSSTPPRQSTPTLSSKQALSLASTLSSTPTLQSTLTLAMTPTQSSTPTLPSTKTQLSKQSLSATPTLPSMSSVSSTTTLPSTPTLSSTPTRPSVPTLTSTTTWSTKLTLASKQTLSSTPTLQSTQSLLSAPTLLSTLTLSTPTALVSTILSKSSGIAEEITSQIQADSTTVSLIYSSVTGLSTNTSDMERSTLSISPSLSVSSMIMESLNSSTLTVSVTSSAPVTTTSIIPTTTIPPKTTTLNGTNANERYWVRTVLKIQRNINVSDPTFVSNMENGLANAFNEAFIRKKLVDEGKFEPLRRRRRRKRYTSVGDASVHIHDLSRTEATTTVAADYTVEQSGKVLTADEAVEALEVLDTQELAILLKQVVDVKAEAYIQTDKPDEPVKDDSQLWLYGIIAGSIAGVVVVIWIIVCIYCKCCRQKNSEEDAEPELTSIQPQPSKQKTSPARPLPTTPRKKTLIPQGSKFSLWKGRTYQINDGYVPEKETEEQTLLKSPRKKETQSPVPSITGSATVTPMMPKKELVPPAVKKGRRNSKNSIGPATEDLDFNNDIKKLGSLEADKTQLFQSSVSEDSDDTKEQLKMQKKKNKDRMSEKYGQEIEAKHRDKGKENTDNNILGMPNTTVPSFVIESGSPSKEPIPLSRKFSDGNTSGDENLEEARNRMHKLLDDAFSLISPRSSFSENDLRKGTSTSNDEKSTNSRQSSTNVVDVDKAIETLKGFTNPAYTSSYSGLLETWSPYRASDQVALISMPQKPEPVVTRLGYKPDKRPLTSNKAANYVRRPAANLDVTNSKSTSDISESGKYTTNAPKPIVIRTKDDIPNARLESAKSEKNSNELQNKRNVSAVLNNDLLLRGSSTSLNKPTSQAKSNSLEMQHVKRNRSNSIRKHREPEKDNRNRDEIDVIKNIKPEEASDKLFHSLRDEIKGGKAAETEDDINKKPIRRRNRKTHSKPMTDIV